MSEPLDRIAAALERMSPAPAPAPDFSTASAFVWHVEPDRLIPVPEVSRVDLSLLIGVNPAVRICFLAVVFTMAMTRLRSQPHLDLGI